MDPLSALPIVASTVSVLQLASAIKAAFCETFSANAFLLKHYGLTGLWLTAFASKDVLRSELQVLASEDERVALDFKKATQDESNMIAIAGTIVAQIAVTALSLADLSNTHWTARGLFSFSLVSSIIAVYYASSQHRVVGRCLNASQVKSWIENDRESAIRAFRALYGSRPLGDIRLKKPAASSIATISAPIIMLSASLKSLLGGFGVYLGIVWTKNLDQDAGPTDSRNVFLVYAIGVGVCYGLYALSRLVSQGKKTDRPELNTLLCRVNAPSLDDEPRSDHRQPRNPGEQLSTSSFIDVGQSLVEALQKAATLREESVEADRQVAEIYRELSRQITTHNRLPQGRNDHRYQSTERQEFSHE